MFRLPSFLAFLTGMTMMSSPAAADDMLPVASDHLASAFILERTDARLAVGATVNVIGIDDQGIPKPLEIEGTVLGGDEVVFVEFSQTDAIRLAKARETLKLRIRKAEDPDPTSVADRRAAAERNKPVVIAPYAQSLTVTVESGDANTFQIGDSLTVGTGEYVYSAQFIAAKETAGKRLEMTMTVASAFHARRILAADVGGTLTISPADADKNYAPFLRKGQRCYIRHRRAGETQRIEIPCTSE